MFLDESRSVLRIAESSGVTLEFERAYPWGPDDPSVSGILVRATSDHLQLEQQVTLISTGELSQFLRHLYDDFRGWAGERTWRSLEDELRITAYHDGHVRLVWEVEDRREGKASWTFSAATTHGAGEDMRHLADGFGELLGDTHR